MIGDHYRDKWIDRWPNIPSWPQTTIPSISRQEFDDLKKEVAEMKELLKRAKEYDERTGQPDCEIDEKMDLLRKVAKLVGVDLDDVLRPTKKRTRSPRKAKNAR